MFTNFFQKRKSGSFIYIWMHVMVGGKKEERNNPLGANYEIQSLASLQLMDEDKIGYMKGGP